VRIRRVASRQASRPLLISLKVRRMLERSSGLHKLMSLVNRMGIKLECKALESQVADMASGSLRIKVETV